MVDQHFQQQKQRQKNLLTISNQYINDTFDDTSNDSYMESRVRTPYDSDEDAYAIRKLSAQLFASDRHGNHDGRKQYGDSEVPTNRHTTSSSSPTTREGYGRPVRRMPTRRPDPSVCNRNALMARENRKRKKEYMQTLEEKMETVVSENKQMRKLVKWQEHTINKINKEKIYLQSILANRTEITGLLQSIQGNQFPTSSSIMNSLWPQQQKKQKTPQQLRHQPLQKSQQPGQPSPKLKRLPKLPKLLQPLRTQPLSKLLQPLKTQPSSKLQQYQQHKTEAQLQPPPEKSQQQPQQQPPPEKSPQQPKQLQQQPAKPPLKLKPLKRIGKHPSKQQPKQQPQQQSQQKSPQQPAQPPLKLKQLNRIGKQPSSKPQQYQPHKAERVPDLEDDFNLDSSPLLATNDDNDNNSELKLMPPTALSQYDSGWDSLGDCFDTSPLPDKLLAASNKSTVICAEHNYFNSSIMNAKNGADPCADNRSRSRSRGSSSTSTSSSSKISTKTPGVCLHVAGGRVSLEFCESCHCKAQSAWN